MRRKNSSSVHKPEGSIFSSRSLARTNLSMGLLIWKVGVPRISGSALTWAERRIKNTATRATKNATEAHRRALKGERIFMGEISVAQAPHLLLPILCELICRTEAEITTNRSEERRVGK